jgi:hypothetical protein
MARLNQLKQAFINFRLDDAKKLHLQQFADNPYDRRLINRLRTLYWYIGLQRKTQLTTAYQLENHFEPQGNIETPAKNKWSKYPAGKHKPGPTLIALVDAKAPGSAREINHPLWEVLRLGDRALPKIDVWLEKLEPRVQAIVYRSSKEGGISIAKQRQSYSLQLSRRLVKLGNLDALAALVLYWRESKQTNNHVNNQWQARDIYRLLLMMGMDFQERRIGEELYVVFLAQVFCQTDWGDRQFAVNSNHYMQAVALLNDVLCQVPKLMPFASWANRCRAMALLLQGQYGLDVHFGLGVVLSPNWQYGPPTEQQRDLWQIDFMQWQWGWMHLCLESVGFYGRDWLWIELNKQPW